jgi:hypothetical protein
VPGHELKDNKNRVVRYDTFDQEIRIGAVLSYSSDICGVKIREEPDDIGEFDNDELISMLFKPLRFVALIEINLSTEARWRRCAHCPSKQLNIVKTLADSRAPVTG